MTIHHREDVMGTVVTIDVYLAAGATARQAAAARQRIAGACAVLHRADEVFSTWRPGSPLSRLRRGEITAGQAPPEMARVLARCAVAREVSGRWFDPWAMPGGVDPTGYVKGWAAQRALGILGGPGVCGAIVNAAGDLASSGGLAGGQPFRIGIADPAAPRQLAAVVRLTGAIATSGTYERGRHLIDPRTGRPAAGAASASVTGPDLGLADALATALAVTGETGPLPAGYEALIIGFDGRWRWTPGFPFAQVSPVSADAAGAGQRRL
ncbi:MAG: FAD:protein FMN transferase [Gemmatimonadota bacterium]